MLAYEKHMQAWQEEKNETDNDPWQLETALLTCNPWECVKWFKDDWIRWGNGGDNVEMVRKYE